MKEILITSSVLIVALLLLRLLFAKKVRRGLIYAAWALVALRLLIPVQIGQLDFSVLTAAQPLTETVEEVSSLRVVGQNEREANIQVTKDYIERDQTVFTPEVQEYIQSAQKENRPAEEIATAIVKTQGSQVYVPEVREQVAQQVAEQTDFVSIGQLVRIIWLSGVAAMVVWFAIVNLRHGLMLGRNREPLTCESPIPVFVSEKVASPCLVGLFRPAVYLTPQSAASEETLRHVLTHELTHYRHGDHIWSLVRCVCLCVYWFDPLVWAAAYMSRRDCELACDEGALQRLGEAERIAYGRTLLEVVSHAARHANLLQTATSMNETKKQLKERVNFIVKKRKISITAAICMVLVCAIVAGCVAAGPTNGQQNLGTDPLASTPSSAPAMTQPTQTQPTTVATQPTTVPTTVPTQPTKPTEPENEELAKFNALFGDYRSWYHMALVCQYVSPEQIDLWQLFYNGFKDESRKPTDAELAELQALPDFEMGYELIRLPVDKMNQVLTDIFGITLEDVDAAAFEHLGYLESTNCYFLRHTDAMSLHDFNALSVETLEDGTIRMLYEGGSWDNLIYEAILMPHGDGYWVLSNVAVAAIQLDKELATCNTLFGTHRNWYNKTLACEYATPAQLDLTALFRGTFRTEINQVTDSERAQLKDLIGNPDVYDDIDSLDITRLPVERMNWILQQYFGITLDDVDDAGFEGLHYLESTDCYYIIGGDENIVMEFNALAIEYLGDGTVRVTYTQDDWRGDATMYEMILKFGAFGYYILSNQCLE